MTEAIRIEDLHKHYGDVHALDGLTLTVEPGTVFGFLGPNGAGKTTTIRLLTGLAHPTRGRAWVAGHDITDRTTVSRRIGYLGEEPAFYRWMTPAEMLDYVGQLFGLPTAERKARTKELLALVDLTRVRRRRIGGFSRGMRQRLGLAQALVNRPEVLFLDEPVSALDPAGRKEVLDLIDGLRGQCTVFMSSHILSDVQRVCDTVGILNHGKLIVEARQDELLSRYTIPVLELECDEGCEPRLAAWVESLRGIPWVASTALEGNLARIVVNDLAMARHELLKQAAAADLALRRYEVVTPSLEDIFLRLVGEEGGTA